VSGLLVRCEAPHPTQGPQVTCQRSQGHTGDHTAATEDWAATIRWQTPPRRV
jgi:hypothetical protein